MKVNLTAIGKTIEGNIALLCAKNNTPLEKVWRIACVSRSTRYARKTKPGDWTLGQLAYIAGYFGKPVEWLLVEHEI